MKVTANSVELSETEWRQIGEAAGWLRKEAVAIDSHSWQRAIERAPGDVQQLIINRVKQLQRICDPNKDYAIEVYKFPKQLSVADPTKPKFDRDGFTNSSNGDMFVAVIRKGVCRTMMLRRSPEAFPPQPFNAAAFRVDVALRLSEVQQMVAKNKPKQDAKPAPSPSATPSAPETSDKPRPRIVPRINPLKTPPPQSPRP